MEPSELKQYQQFQHERYNNSNNVMQDYPLARQYEFKNALAFLQLADDLTVVDYPSGAGYLKPFIDNDIELLNFKFIEPFLSQGRDGRHASKQIQESDNKIPLATASVDRFLSIAGLHHIDNLSPFFNEAHRVLKPTGIFVIAEVLAKSPPALFLNEFVDQYSSAGHKGLFLTHTTCSQLELCGFKGVSITEKDYPWTFSCQQEMIDFCRGLFTLEKASDEIIKQGLKDYLGFRQMKHEVHLNWKLAFFQAFR